MFALRVLLLTSLVCMGSVVARAEEEPHDQVLRHLKAISKQLETLTDRVQALEERMQKLEARKSPASAFLEYQPVTPVKRDPRRLDKQPGGYLRFPIEVEQGMMPTPPKTNTVPRVIPRR